MILQVVNILKWVDKKVPCTMAYTLRPRLFSGISLTQNLSPQ